MNIKNLKTLTIKDPVSLMELDSIGPYDYLEIIPQISYYWETPITITTSFFDGFGTFTWFIPENEFEKVPVGNKWDVMKIEKFKKINESFQIQFLCETKDNFPYEDKDVKEAMLSTFYDEPYYRNFIKNIQFKVNEDSLLTAEDLLWSLIHQLNWTLWGWKKDLVVIPTKETRIKNGWL